MCAVLVNLTGPDSRAISSLRERCFPGTWHTKLVSTNCSRLGAVECPRAKSKTPRFFASIAARARVIPQWSAPTRWTGGRIHPTRLSRSRARTHPESEPGLLGNYVEQRHPILAEVADEDHVTRGFALGEKQLLPIPRPGKIENAPRSEVGYLARHSTGERLFPDIRGAIPRQEVLHTLLTG